MDRQQLAHILRAACDVSGDPDVIVLGSPAGRDRTHPEMARRHQSDQITAGLTSHDGETPITQYDHACFCGPLWPGDSEKWCRPAFSGGQRLRSQRAFEHQGQRRRVAQATFRWTSAP
jgi:hypothetical protein